MLRRHSTVHRCIPNVRAQARVRRVVQAQTALPQSTESRAVAQRMTIERGRRTSAERANVGPHVAHRCARQGIDAGAIDARTKAQVR